MSLHHYRFTSVWLLGAPSTAVFDAVVDLASYPAWWPDIRSVLQLDEDTADVVCRASLPYAIRFRMRRAMQDSRAGRVRVELSGDIEGSLHGRLTARQAGTRLVIAQHVVVHKRLLRTFAPVARPLFRANHAAMMRRGQRGLASYIR